MESQLHLFHMIKHHKPDFLFLAEPLISFDSIPSWYWTKLNLHNHVLNSKNSNSTPTLWCLWNKQHNITISHNAQQCIALSFIVEDTFIFIAIIYAYTFYIKRRALWLELSTLIQNHPGPWMFIGDFNSILGAHEKVGGRIPLHIACSEFSSWSNMHSLTHLETSGAKFTWINKREGGAFIAQRLDRAIYNGDWIDYWSIINCNTLARTCSDHFLLLLTVHKHSPTDIIPRFKFFKTWTTFDSCETIISEHWSASVQGTPMHILHYKLKSLKPKLQVWNRNVVGNFHQRVHLAHHQLTEAQLAIDQLGFSVERSQEELACLTNYSQALTLLHRYWKDKNKRTRFLEGDRNTAYFHRSCKIRDAQSFMSLLKNGDEVIADNKDIEAHVQHYFTNIFAAQTDCVENNLPD